MMKKSISGFVALLICVCMVFGSTAMLIGFSSAAPEQDFGVKNVILMIGDGMGFNHIAAARQYTGSSLNLDRFTYTGQSRTKSASSPVTDSAAGATALSTGRKTNNYIVGMSPELVPLLNMTEAANSIGKMTAVVSTDGLNGATPAAFSSHASDRNLTETIILSQLESKVDVFFAAGRSTYSAYDAQITEAGFKHITTPEELMLLTKSDGRVMGNFGSDVIDNTTVEPKLSTMLRRATELIENDNGFFMMAEGAKIDTYSHSNDIYGMIRQLIGFDEAVGEAMSYVDAHPGTLLIVTADHETGGLTLPADTSPEAITNDCYTLTGHSGVNVPIFTYGAHAGAFVGEHENTDIAKYIASMLGIKNFAKDEPEPENTTPDYMLTDISGFSDWDFDTTNGGTAIDGLTITQNSGSANATAVTARCNSSTTQRLYLISKPRVGYSFLAEPPVSSPFRIGDNGDLSAYDGIAMSVASSIMSEIYTITLGRKGGDSPFSATYSFRAAAFDECKLVRLPFEDFSPAITPDMAKDMDVFGVTTNGRTSQFFMIIDGIYAYSEDTDMNYSQAYSEASTLDREECSPEDWDAFSALFADFSALKEQYESSVRLTNYRALINSKHQLISALADLERYKYDTLPSGLIDDWGNAHLGDNPASSMVVGLHNRGDGYQEFACEDSRKLLSFFIAGESSSFKVIYGNFLLGLNINDGAGIRLHLAADDYSHFSGPQFAVKLSVGIDENTYENTVTRPLNEKGYYYFSFRDFLPSAVPQGTGAGTLNSLEISVSGAEPFASLFVSDAELYNLSVPVISGVEDGGEYDIYHQTVEPTWGGYGRGVLNGDEYAEGTPIEAVGEYELTVHNGSVSTTVVFTVKDTTPQYVENDLDGDGEITVSDALTALRMAVGLTECGETDLLIGDTDDDGIISVADALFILRKSIDLI